MSETKRASVRSTPTPDVPKVYIGVWKRSLLTTGSGLRDTSATVYWLQTKELFADLRIPVPEPAEGCSSLQECTGEQLLQLAQQQGFAGITTVLGDLCTWHRELDYQPKSGPPDVGKMAFAFHDHLTEDDPSGKNKYHEDWQRVQGSDGLSWGYRLQAANQADRKGFLLGAGNYFFFVGDRCVSLETMGELTSQLQLATLPVEKRDLLGMELSFGVVEQQGEAAMWTIMHSTLPGRVSRSLLPASCTLDSLASNSCIQAGVFSPKGGWRLLPA